MLLQSDSLEWIDKAAQNIAGGLIFIGLMLVVGMVLHGILTRRS